MKHTLLFCSLLMVALSFGQTKDHIQFEYDAAGNQVKRYLIDITPGRYSNPDVKNVKDLCGKMQNSKEKIRFILKNLLLP